MGQVADGHSFDGYFQKGQAPDKLVTMLKSFAL
jgi:hypothetical protein